MLHTNNPIIKHKTGLLNLAQELSNVSKVCKVMGVSRDTFYRYQELVAEGGIEALITKNRRAPNLKNRVDEAVEAAVKPMRLSTLPTDNTEPVTNYVNKACLYPEAVSDPFGYGMILRISKNV